MEHRYFFLTEVFSETLIWNNIYDSDFSIVGIQSTYADCGLFFCCDGSISGNCTFIQFHFCSLCWEMEFGFQIFEMWIFLFLSQKKSPVTVVKQRPEAKHSQKSVLTAMLMCNVQCQTESKNLIVQRALAALTLSCCDQFWALSMWTSRCIFHRYIQSRAKVYKRLLNKTYVNVVTLRGQNLSLKYC